MVLHTRGRVGRRQLFLQASFNRFVERGFFLCINFWEGASLPEDDASSTGGIASSLTWGRRIPLGEDAFLARNEKD